MSTNFINSVQQPTDAHQQQCAAVKSGDNQPCGNDALPGTDYCTIHQHWHERTGNRGIWRHLTYAPASEHTHTLVQGALVLPEQIQIPDTTWEGELVETYNQLMLPMVNKSSPMPWEALVLHPTTTSPGMPSK